MATRIGLQLQPQVALQVLVSHAAMPAILVTVSQQEKRTLFNAFHTFS